MTFFYEIILFCFYVSRVYMPPAKLLPAAKVLEAFADCRRQSKPAKENGEICPLYNHKWP